MTMTHETTNEPTRSVDRWRDPVLGWSATLAVVSAFAVLLVPHATLDAPDPSAAQVTAFFTEHYTMQQAQPLLHAVSGVLLMVFLARVSAVLRQVGGPRAGDVVLAAGAALGAVVVVTMGWVAAVVTMTGDIEGRLQWDLYNLGWDFHFRLLYLLPLVLLPTGWVLRRSGATILGWVTLGLGGLCSVAPLGYLGRDTWFVQYPAYMVFLIWTLTAGIALGLRGVRPRP